MAKFERFIFGIMNKVNNFVSSILGDRVFSIIGDVFARIDGMIESVLDFFGMNTRQPIDSKMSLAAMSAADALFKIQPRASVSCYSDGIELVKGINQLFWAMFADVDNIYSQDEFNLEDVLLMFFRKCNVFDTLPATILINLQIKALDYISESIDDKFVWLIYPHYVLLYTADFAGAWTNLAESAYSF
jgi:hypothetical protein